MPPHSAGWREEGKERHSTKTRVINTPWFIWRRTTDGPFTHLCCDRWFAAGLSLKMVHHLQAILHKRMGSQTTMPVTGGLTYHPHLRDNMLWALNKVKQNFENKILCLGQCISFCCMLLLWHPGVNYTTKELRAGLCSKYQRLSSYTNIHTNLLSACSCCHVVHSLFSDGLCWK